jgi:hypothetical protein
MFVQFSDGADCDSPLSNQCVRLAAVQISYLQDRIRRTPFIDLVVCSDWDMSIRTACRALEFDRSTYHYNPVVPVTQLWNKESNQTDLLKKNIARRKGMSPIRVLIEATLPEADLKQKSRWVRALEYVYSENESPSQFRKFIRTRGGVAGCARLAVNANRKRRRPGGRLDRLTEVRENRRLHQTVDGLRR